MSPEEVTSPQKRSRWAQNCIRCGKEFYPKKSQKAKYCGKECFNLSNQPNMAECLVCKKKYKLAPKHAARHGGKTYCSRKCFATTIRGSGHHLFRGAEKHTCATCGKDFQVPTYMHERGNVRFCSVPCRAKGMEKPAESRKCLHCGKPFDVMSSAIKRHCSHTCASKAHAVRIAGRANGRYVHGNATEVYNTGFRLLRQKIWALDGWRCVLCGKMGKLHTHHINYDKKDDRLENLMTCCNYCHGTLHGLPQRREELKVIMSQKLQEHRRQIMSTT